MSSLSPVFGIVIGLIGVFLIIIAVWVMFLDLSMKANRSTKGTTCDHVFYPVPGTAPGTYLGQACAICGHFNSVESLGLSSRPTPTETADVNR